MQIFLDHLHNQHYCAKKNKPVDFNPALVLILYWVHVETKTMDILFRWDTDNLRDI